MMNRKAANMQITRECNNECVFCSNPQFEKDYTLKDARDTALRLKEEGITEIFLSGGEPTICRFLFEIIAYLKKIGIEPRMVTNGVELSDKSFVKKLHKAGLRNINVSVHSHKEETADKLSQRKGHFKRTLKGISNLLEEDFAVTINSTINSLNCKYLLEFVKFFDSKFPKINHFVFNGLDPGCSDGVLRSRAGQNPWVVPKFVDFELSLNRAADFLIRRNKTFRVERVPLCYMGGFEDCSTETRKIVKNERYITSFIEKTKKNELRRVSPTQFRMKAECCRACRLDEICAGVQKEYLLIHGDKELYPVFCSPLEIIKKIKEQEKW